MTEDFRRLGNLPVPGLDADAIMHAMERADDLEAGSVVPILEELWQYYAINRRVGHTELMIHGTLRSSEAVILAHDQRWATELAHRSGGKFAVTPNSLYRLRGMRKPMAIDNAALEDLFRRAYNEINFLRSKIIVQNALKHTNANLRQQVRRTEQERDMFVGWYRRCLGHYPDTEALLEYYGD